MSYEDFKDLNRITIADKVLRDKAFNIAKNPKCDIYQCALASLFYNLFDQKNLGETVKNEVICNEELVEELCKPSIRKFEKRNKHSSFKDNILGSDFHRFRFFLFYWHFIGNIHGLFL